MSATSLAPERLLQNINPWNFMARVSGQQFGFINLYTQSTADPDTEAAITQGVASYGRQLGRINEVLQVLLAHLQLDPEHVGTKLTEGERDTIRAFATLCADIERAKEKANPTYARIRELEAEVAALRKPAASQ